MGLLLLTLAWWVEKGGRARLEKVAQIQQANRASSTSANKFAKAASAANLSLRLSNSGRSGDELLRDDGVVELANAVIDVRRPEAEVPEGLRAGKDNGTWIVVGKGPLDGAFRGMLAEVGAEVVSFIPNNAELVRASGGQVLRLRASPLVSAVLAYHPYYKVMGSRLLDLAVQGKEPPSDVSLEVGLYSDSLNKTLAQLKALRVAVSGVEQTPFGYAATVHPPRGGFLALTRLDGVMVVGVAPRRVAANDLTRVTLGVSSNSVTNAGYLGLTGSNVLVGIIDSGVDNTHPDLAGRVWGDVPGSLTDVIGHGTHVAGTIFGNGSQSATVPITNASGSVSNALFSGMAPNANGLSVGIPLETRPRQNGGFPASDRYVQEVLARSNALVGNLSWVYDGDSQYDLHAAGFDAATRDGLAGVGSPQPTFYVVAAGNIGAAELNGSGGIGDTILSPATGKNVLSVGALEVMRKITNRVSLGGATNEVFLPETDSSNEVAELSSRGNVGIGLEGGGGTVQAGPGGAGDVFDLNQVGAMEPGGVLQPDERDRGHAVQPDGGAWGTGGLFGVGPAQCGGAGDQRGDQRVFAEPVSEPADLREDRGQPGDQQL